MFIDRRNFFNCHRLFYVLIVSLFICIGIYNYRYVERHRKYEEDQNYLINQAKIQNIVKPTWKHQSRNETSDVLKDKYFSQLEPEQVSLLINMFKFDLELFGYSAKDYEKYFRGSELSRSKLTCKRKNEFIN
ncbi:uncharacterized protein LOC141528667 isoform X3 [Cotesia typhae]|uniref:uncharacterized protein LOC141528667 isoform X3 n=1 Tax=Cotesia typhae TaxID=2053667 RepID=UPI003D69BAAB